MKSKKKVLGLLVCAVLLVVGSVMGTMAWLTKNSEVATNTFTVGNVAITLDEAKVNDKGQPINAAKEVVDVDAAPRVLENEYKLLPGHSYTKDPIVHVGADSDECWLFVKVVNTISDLEVAADQATDEKETIAEQMAQLGWTEVAANVYAYKEVAFAGQNIYVFKNFYLANDAAVEARNPITVEAYAVQADGFGTAEAAWTAAPATWKK